ncbi:MAG: lipopolysaccharide biosynthesis protein [Lachnospiraceae bacterium]|nr:lipopolysaccharide biosynthesis protein [Lachnospiraceae bacterium]
MDFNTNVNNRIVMNSLTWKILERLFSQGISFLVQVILARLLMPNDFGSLAIIVAIINYAAIFVQSGLATAIVQKENLEEIDVFTMFTLSLGIGTALYVLLYCIAPIIVKIYSLPELLWPIRVLSITLLLNGINSIQTAIYSRKMQFKKLFLRSAFSVTISGVIGIGMAYNGYGLWALVIQNIVYAFVSVIVMSIKSEFPLKVAFSLPHAKEIYNFSGKILLTDLLSGTHDTIRTMLIGKKYSSDELAYYDKANTYSYYVTLIVNSSISSVLLSAFSRKQSDIENLRRIARKSVRMTSFIMFPILFGVMSVADALINVLLSDKWEASIPFLMIFCMLRLPDCIVSIDKQVFLALGRSDLSLYSEILFFCLTVGLLLQTIKYGTIAIALGALFGEIIYGVIICMISSRIYGYSLHMRIKDLIKPFFSSAVMSASIYFLRRFYNNKLICLVIQVVMGIIIYLLLAILMRDENLKEIWKILEGRFAIKKK